MTLQSPVPCGGLWAWRSNGAAVKLGFQLAWVNLHFNEDCPKDDQGADTAVRVPIALEKDLVFPSLFDSLPLCV